MLGSARRVGAALEPTVSLPGWPALWPIRVRPHELAVNLRHLYLCVSYDSNEEPRNKRAQCRNLSKL